MRWNAYRVSLAHGAETTEQCDVGATRSGDQGGERPSGSAAGLGRSEVCRGSPVFDPHGPAVAGLARGVWCVERGIHALPPVGESGRLATIMGAPIARRDPGLARPVRRQHQHPCPSPRRWGTQKNGADQASGRSRGGLTTKLHAASTNEHTAVALTLTARERHDLIGFDALYTQAQEGGTLTRLTADRAYDADRVCARLAADNVACVIPPRQNRLRPPLCSRRLYRRRHKIENWFRKLQDFRRLATRYDKLAACYLALVHLAGTFILLGALVSTP